MHINFECSGGYANLRLTYRADTDELPQEIAQELLRLVENSRVFDLPQSAVASTSAGPPDVFFYQISLHEGNRQTSLSFNDVTAPTALRHLLSRLRQLALEQRQKSK